MSRLACKYSETGLKQPLKNRQLEALKPCGSLMQVKSTAECSMDYAIFLTCIKAIIGLENLFLFVSLRLVLLYMQAIVVFSIHSNG